LRKHPKGGRLLAKKLMKESILFGIPAPSLEAQTDNSLAVISAACSKKNVLSSALLSKGVSRIAGGTFQRSLANLPRKLGKERLHCESTP